MKDKIRLMRLGKKQKDLIIELANREIKIDSGNLSNIINGKYPGSEETARNILSKVREIMTEWENEERR